MSQVLHTSETAFENDVLKSNVPVVVDFWAEWCGPCRVISPIIEELSKEYNGKVQFAKVNVDESPDLAGRFGVQGIPTLIIFKDAKEVGRLVGAAPKSRLAQEIEKIL
ncbi:MAG: thioredoxin [Bacteroidetes bacterium]|nr:thioredoxin [Bacteroidota bacterium]